MKSSAELLRTRAPQPPRPRQRQQQQRPITSGIPMPVTPSFGGAKPRTATRIATTTTTLAKKGAAAAVTGPDKFTGSATESNTTSRIPGTTVKRKLSLCTRTKACCSGVVTTKRERPDPEACLPPTSSKRGVPSRPKLHDKRKPGLIMFSKTVGGNSDVAAHHRTTRCRDDVAQLEREKYELQQRVSELVLNAEAKKAEVINLKVEIGKLRDLQKSRSETVLSEVESLHCENRLLRDRLEELGFPLGRTALSDTEKELLMSKKCSSAPPSISGAPTTGLATMLFKSGGDAMDAESDGDVLVGAFGAAERTLSERGSLDWDKQSSSSISEMSVACLQDRIMQMEETHYSTSEELQATLQELSDLQDQLTDLQNDNERLNEEKAMFLESLCSKVQQLEDSRSQVESLQQLLLRQHEDGKAILSMSEREQKLMDILKSSQEEREALLQKQEELNRKFAAGKEEVTEAQLQAANAVDRARLLESTVDSANADKRLLERQLAECRELLSNESIEANRVRMLLETERAKVFELQQARQVQDKSELDELLDHARKEKDRLEGRATSLQEQLALSQCEATRLREQLSVQQEEAMVAKNNAKEQVSDLEYRLQQVLAAKDDVHGQVLDMQEVVHELERKCQRHLEDKRELRATISDLQKKLNESTGRAETVQRQLDELSQKHDRETEEWKQFQSDLLMTVRVANDFKTEAQQDVENLMIEMRHLLDRIQSLEAENERLKAMKTTTSPTFHRKPLQTGTFSDGSVLMSTVEQEIVCLRQGRPARPDTRQSVKSLIESIENASKQSKSTNGSSTGSNKGSPLSPTSTSGSSSPTSEKAILARPDSDLYIKPPSRPVSADSCSSILRDQKNQANTGAMQSLRLQQRNTYAEGNGGQRSPTSNKVLGSADKNQMSPPAPSGRMCSGNPDAAADPSVMKPAAIVSPTPVSILANKTDTIKRTSFGDSTDKKDPLTTLARGGGSRRNALLKWCQNKTVGYRGIDITNFSSSWNDGLAFCAVIHTYLPDLIPYDSLDNKDKRRNFTLAFQAAESVGIPTILNINDMISMERPDWQSVMSYITSIYKHFET